MKSVFFSHAASDSKKVELLAELVTREDVRIVGLDERLWGTPSDAEIFSLIRRSSVFVAFLDEPSRNVMFELGYALGASKQVLLIADPSTPIPFDISSLPVVRYDGLQSAYQIADRLLTMIRDGSVERAEPLRGRQRIGLLVDKPETLDEISPLEFESAIQELFVELGYDVGKGISDHNLGFDLMIRDPQTGLRSVVEIKKYARNGKIGVSSVYQLIRYALLTNASSAILVASCGFSASAVDMAKKSPCPIKLVSLPELVTISKESLAGEDEARVGRTPFSGIARDSR